MLRILILFSDTGGGHRAAAEAICDQLNDKFGHRYETILVDAIVEGAVWPFNNIPKTYLPITKYAAREWGWGFNLSNSSLGMRLLDAAAYPIALRGLTRLFQRLDPDLVITVHPLITGAPFRVLRSLKPNAPFVTVVTDLFDAHAMWFSAPADLLVLPTEGARQHGLRRGFPAERMCVVGLPVNRRFRRAVELDRSSTSTALRDLRTRLGLVPHLFTVLVIGGGEGMGPIGDIARALAGSDLPIQLAIIAGRNASLKRELEIQDWTLPVRVNGFVTNMPEWMSASNLVVTKAGPGTIMETLTVGRPLLISGFLPGQERGNVDFVEQAGVGVYRNTPDGIVQQLREWLEPGNDSLERMTERARAEARPEAAERIANLLDQLLNRRETET